jgi:hypothetical protein
MYKLTLSSYEEIKKTFWAEPASETTSHLDQGDTQELARREWGQITEVEQNKSARRPNRKT